MTIRKGGYTSIIVVVVIVVVLIAPAITATIWNLVIIGFLGVALPTADYWAGLGLNALFVIAMDLLHGVDRKGRK